MVPAGGMIGGTPISGADGRSQDGASREDRPTQVDFPHERIAEFCREHRIRRLRLFGSVLRDDFRPDSDVDVLVEFEPGAVVGLLTLAALELGGIVGRKVDLRTPNELSSYFRQQVLDGAAVLYAA